MGTKLLHAIVRVADVRTSDGELLERFVRLRDERAFEELVRRHGPLVWSVCRQLLPNHADAEDAFQAVFLALIRGAGGIRSGQALPSWLHGVAVRVAEKSRRSSCRRRLREERAAVVEADRPVPDASWAALMAAVHEEVQQLPDAERTAFVLCDLEGVRQPDAAARLGWPLGTLSGRLCKARQRLIEQLTRRGIVPGVLAIGGLAGTSGLVPAALAAKVSSFPFEFANGVSSTVAHLARGLVGGTAMRIKAMTAALVVVGAVGLTGGLSILSQADAQVFGGQGAQSATPAPSGMPPSSFGGPGPGGSPAAPAAAQQGGSPPTVVLVGQPPAPPAAVPGGPNGPGMADWLARSGGGSWSVVATSSVEYKFVDLKSEDRELFEKEIKQAGTQGWEFCGSERLMRKSNDGTQLVLVFKKHGGGQINAHAPFGPDGRTMSFGVSGMGQVGMPPFVGVTTTPSTTVTAQAGAAGSARPPAISITTPAAPTTLSAATFKLNKVNPVDVSKALQIHFGSRLNGTVLVVEASTNSLVVAAEPLLYVEIARMIEFLDSATPPRPPGILDQPKAEGAGSRQTTPARGGAGAASPTAGGSPPSMVVPLPGSGPGSAYKIKVLSLRFAKAEEIVTVLQKVFGREVDITADPRTNQLILRGSDEASAAVSKLLEQLDVNPPSR